MSEPDPNLQPMRLDFSRDPPGAPLVGDELGLEYLVREMWAVYKRWHNPPGMWVGFGREIAEMDRAFPRFGLYRRRWELSVSRVVPYVAWRHEARKDAWSFYTARVVLAGKLEAAGATGVWPKVLCILDLAPFDAWVAVRLGPPGNFQSAGPCPELPAW